MKWLLALLVALVLSTSATAVPWRDAVGLQEGIKEFESGNYGPGYQMLRPFAEHGDINAELYVGIALAGGYGVRQDYAEATVWFRKAAAQVNAATDMHLARMLHGQLLNLGEKRFADPAANIHYFLLRMDPASPVCLPGDEASGMAPCADRQKMYRAIKEHLTPEVRAYRDFEVAFFEHWLKPRLEMPH